ncbi:MAG TPA: M48 family metallopeptidase [Xanthomonadaceae bacterium]|nr:M48 family metallopeptidase [Xanthomonadaceae bacterium]
MNFFARQRQARGQTRRLVLLFALAVIAIVVAVDLVLIAAFGYDDGRLTWDTLRDDPMTLVIATLVTLSIIGGASLIKIAQLRSGGGAVARELGGTPVEPGTRDIKLARLRNVVEEVAIASGVPVPEIFVMESEAGINAFAAGFTPADAAVAVTRGAIDNLTREELQGVVAHEFSHILNGDMRLNIRLIGMLHGILAIALIGRLLLRSVRYGGRARSSGSRDRGGGVAALLAVGLALWIIGSIGVLFGRLIKSGVSRQREYLADASAVQFTRQTRGISGALMKIAGLPVHSRIDAGRGEEVSHMLFGDGFALSGAFATHPPIEKRLQALDPSFRPERLKEVSKRLVESKLPLDRVPASAMFAGFAAGAALPDEKATMDIDPHSVPGQIAAPDQHDFDLAGGILSGIPAALTEAAHSHDDAPAITLALLLAHDDETLHARQLRLIESALGAETSQRTAALAEACRSLHALMRLPLVEMAFPSLRRRPRPEIERLLVTAQRLIHADGKVELFEYCLARLVSAHLRDALDPSRTRPIGRRRLRDLRAELGGLFSVLAAKGHDSREAAQFAFNAGIGLLLRDQRPPFNPPDDWIATLDRAMTELDRLDGIGKELLVEALAACASHDGKITVAEAELLRTVCGCLHCPLPPLLQQAVTG